MPALVDDAMADLAITFHWRPGDMDVMPLAELAAWRERARRRNNPEDK